MRISFTLSVICLVLSVVVFCSYRSGKTDQQRAIKLAEDFIRRNGYTDKPVDTSTHKLSYELLDQYSEKTAALITQRHNTLQPKAFCVSYSEQNKEWHIGFLSAAIAMSSLDSTRKNSNLPGRAVIVSENGNDIRMAHKTPLFSQFKKL